MKNGSRVLRCACGCGKTIRVGMGVIWVLTAECSMRLNSVYTKLAAKKAKKAS